MVRAWRPSINSHVAEPTGPEIMELEGGGLQGRGKDPGGCGVGGVRPLTLQKAESRSLTASSCRW